MPGNMSLLNPNSTDRQIRKPIRDLVDVPTFQHQISEMPRTESALTAICSLRRSETWQHWRWDDNIYVCYLRS